MQPLFHKYTAEASMRGRGGQMKDTKSNVSNHIDQKKVKTQICLRSASWTLPVDISTAAKTGLFKSVNWTKKRRSPRRGFKY